MKLLIGRLAFGLVFLLLCSTFTVQAQNVIPIPLHMQRGEGSVVLPTQLPFYTNLKRSEARLMKECLNTVVSVSKGKKQPKSIQVNLLLTVADGLTTSESYTLSVTPQQIVIKGKTGAALFYGLQTLMQLMEQKAGQIEVPVIEIADTPRFAYRGLMLDVSRHFFSKEFVKKQMDALAYYKFNRLHLHLTDAAGWRLAIKKYPRLTDFAAWRTDGGWKKWWFGDRKYLNRTDSGAAGGYYTRDDIRELLEYARQRYITIIPEIEMPGHSEEVLAAYPQLSCAGEPYKNSDFCVGNEETFTFLENVLTEVMDLFPSEYIHIGGDEAGKSAWKSCPKCQKRIHDEHLDGVDGLQSYMIHRIEKFLNAHGRKLLGWDEILEGGLAPNATVMSWRGESGGLAAVRSGHRAIMTPGKYCYFDAYQDAPPFEPEAIGGYLPLDKVYSYNPVPDSLTVAEAALIYGVQANLWTEYVPTPEHAEYMIWPRLLALSEVAWSAPERKSWPAFRERVLKASADLQQKGYHPFDLNKERGKRQEARQPVTHLAVGKKVIYNAPYSPRYVAKGDGTLTDGWLGDWTYGDGAWQGFITRQGVDVTIDMEQITNIHSVSAEFMQAVGPGVFWPGEVTISVSTDGVNYTTLKKEQYTGTKEPPFGFKIYGWEGEAKARYIRYQGTTSTEYHGFVFTSEIVVR